MREHIRKILASVLGLPPERVTEDISVETVESWDSLKQIRLIMSLEQKFGITFGDDAITRLTSFGAIVQAVEAHKK